MTVTMDAGSAWMLTGPNGSGKSTMLRCMATALKPHRGHILVDGTDLWENRQTLRAEIAYLGHELHVWDDLSPRQNLQAWNRLGRFEVDVDGLLERVNLEPHRDHPVRAMSAGMKRRLGLARLLLKKPRLALLDEPFGALDPEGRELVLDVIRELRTSGTTIALATHLPRIGAQACTHGLALEAGQLLWAGTAAGLLERIP